MVNYVCNYFYAMLQFKSIIVSYGIYDFWRLFMEYKMANIVSSREFYRMIDELNRTLHEGENCILDFTSISRIDALVIPNLILLGRLIESKTKFIPYIRLGEDLSAGYLKNYLAQIGFYSLSEPFYYYENPYGKYGGLIGKRMDKRNTTECFSFLDGEAIARRRLFYNILPYLDFYLNEFNIYKSEDVNPLNIASFNNNIIAKFLEQMIDNTFEYGECDAYVTVQTNYKMNRIYLSISDYGFGFYKSIMGEKNSKLFSDNNDDDVDGYNVLKRQPVNEFEAILIGMYKRKNSKTYGLFNVIKKVLQYKGVIRIHSNDSQIILDEDATGSFIDESLARVKKVSRYNFIETSIFNGVHIEIELPLKKTC